MFNSHGGTFVMHAFRVKSSRDAPNNRALN